MAGSSYTVNGGEEQTGDSDFDIVIGTKAKVSYTGEDFLYWVNISNNIVSTEPDFTFTFVNETTLRLITSRNKEMEKSIYVIFRNAYAQILTAGRIIDEEGAEELFPKNNPGMMGLEFDKWIIEATGEEATPRSIADLIGTDLTTIMISPVYKEAAYKYHVKFFANYSGGTYAVFDTGVPVSDPYVAYVADAAETIGLDPSTFSFWALDEDALIPASYDPEQFTVTGSADQVITITAVFEHDVDPEPVVAITGFTASKNGEKFRLSVTMSFYLPEGYTLHKSGFVRSTDGKVFEEEDLVIGAEFTKVHETSFTANSGIYTMNLNTSDPDKKFCFRAFITFTDSEGVLHTLYSSMVRGSFNSFSD